MKDRNIYIHKSFKELYIIKDVLENDKYFKQPSVKVFNLCQRQVDVYTNDHFKTCFIKTQNRFLKIAVKTKILQGLFIKIVFNTKLSRIQSCKRHRLTFPINGKIHINNGDFLCLYNSIYPYEIIIKVQNMLHIYDNVYIVTFNFIGESILKKEACL